LDVLGLGLDSFLDLGLGLGVLGLEVLRFVLGLDSFLGLEVLRFVLGLEDVI